MTQSSLKVSFWVGCFTLAPRSLRDPVLPKDVMEQVKDNGKTEQKWPREPILGVLGTNAISHLAGGGAPSSLGHKNTFLVFLPDCKAPDRQRGQQLKLNLLTSRTS